jgi:hypothetical protein
MHNNPVSVTLIPANDVVIFVGASSDIDETAGTLASKDANGYFTPQNSVIEVGPETLYSFPARVIKESGQLTAIIVPEGVELEQVSLTGNTISIEAADTSARY